MIPKHIVEKIDKLLDVFKSYGMSNKNAIKEISKMIIIILMYDCDEYLIFDRANVENRFKNSVEIFDDLYTYSDVCNRIRNNEHNLIIGMIFDTSINELSLRAINEASYILRNIITKQYSKDKTDLFKLGEVYEVLLSKTIDNLNVGLFVTPRYLVTLMVGLVEPHNGDRILDFTCGTGGFLVGCSNYLKSKDEEIDCHYYGNDINNEMLFYALLNNLFHGRKNINLTNNDIFDNRIIATNDKYDIVLSNPPVGVKLQNHQKSRKSEIIAANKAIDYVKEGGKVAILIPDGILSNSSRECIEFRERLLKVAKKLCVISLPSGVFEPYTSSKASLLVFEKNEVSHLNQEKSILMAELSHEIKDLSRTNYIVNNKMAKLVENYSEYVIGSLNYGDEFHFTIIRYNEIEHSNNLTAKLYINTKMKKIDENEDLSSLIYELIESEERIIDDLKRLHKEIESDEWLEKM